MLLSDYENTGQSKRKLSTSKKGLFLINLYWQFKLVDD